MHGIDDITVVANSSVDIGILQNCTKNLVIRIVLPAVSDEAAAIRTLIDANVLPSSIEIGSSSPLIMETIHAPRRASDESLPQEMLNSRVKILSNRPLVYLFMTDPPVQR